MAIKKLDLLRVITSSNYLYNFSSSYSNKAKTASYALNASGGGGSSLRTGSTYPITASYANRAITASYALNASGGGSSLAGAQTFVSNGSQTIYTLNQSVVNRDQILVVTNGVVQSRTGSNYTVSGTTLTLSEAVQSGGLVDVRYINAGQGSSGTSGANGTSGTNGTSGANGTSGTSGAGSTLATGSTYPITSSYARKSVTASYLTTISQSLIPAKNNVYSLGSPTKKWKDIYVSTASIYFDNYPLRVAVKNNSPQLLFNTRSIVTVPSGSNPSTSSYATKALTASYALNASGGGGGSTLRTGSTYPITSSFARRAITASYALNTFFQTGSIVKQTILYNVVSGSSNTISGLSLGGNKWDVSVVEEWDAISGDLFYNSSSLLMHFSGSNGSTTFIDNSPSVKTVTSNNGAAISSLQSKFGNRSGLFDGVDDYLSISGNTVCNFGSSNFTVECWVRLNAMPTSDAWPTNYSSHFVVITAGTPNLGDGIGFIIGQTKLIVQNNDSQIINATHGMTTNTWYHIAYVRSGNTLYLFVNGTQIGSTASFSSTVGTGATTYIGCETGQGAFFNGYMDELRVTKGIARYTSNFTEPSAEFGNVRGQVATKYIGTVGGLNDRSVDYGVQKLSDSSLRIVKMSVPGLPYPALSGSLSGSVSRVYVNVLDYTKVSVTSSYASRALTSSYLNVISQSLVPARNNIYSLGSATKKWKDIYVSTASIYFDNYKLRVGLKNNSPQLLFNSSSLVMVASGSNTNTASYATNALNSVNSLDIPKIKSIIYTNSSYTPTTASAVDTIKPNTNYITISGSNFKPSASVFIDSTSGSVVTYVNSTKLNVNVVSKNEGTYPIYLSNVDGASTFKINAITYITSLDQFQYVVVAGGGGGGIAHAGGGGAGGFRTGSLGLNRAVTYSVSIGSGGATSPSRSVNGTNGSNSVFASITSIGGGGGGSEYKGGNSGGSGGGGATGGPPVAPGGSGSLLQGNAGGAGSPSNPPYIGGGGGGAGAVGGTATPTSAGNGGIGGISSITGTSTYYAGGGGGGAYGGNAGVTSAGTGGLGGGGNGNYGNGNGSAGTTNRGGGGGGGGYSNENGYNGGSGIVILKYLSSRTLTIGVGLTSSTVTTGSYKITTFTAGSDTIIIS